MAGGDGSQALVASVASRHGLPFVVVPAGTRNHFALDLGIDREDVPGSLDAFRDGTDRLIDLAEVNGRVFVNNAAMGVYATVVQSADYRDAKIQTVASMLPDLLGPTAQPSDLHCTLPSGDDLVAGQLLLISNNPYELHHLRGGGRRTRLDAGVLGAASVTVSTAADVEALTALELTGRVDQFHGWREWTAPTIEVRSTRPVEVGVDGEALVLDPPLRFVIRPAALTVRASPRRDDRRAGRPADAADRPVHDHRLVPAGLRPPKGHQMIALPTWPGMPSTDDPASPSGGSWVEPIERSTVRWRTSPRPVLDLPLRRISDFANHSKPWFIVAGGPGGLRWHAGTGRRAHRRRRHRAHLASW